MQFYSSDYDRTLHSLKGFVQGWLTEEKPVLESRVTTIPIHVSAPTECFLNPYQMFPEIQFLKQQLEQNHSALSQREKEMQPIREQLIQLLPCLTTDTFTWMKPMDYFHCRRAHELPLIDNTQVSDPVHSRYVMMRVKANKLLMIKVDIGINGTDNGTFSVSISNGRKGSLHVFLFRPTLNDELIVTVYR